MSVPGQLRLLLTKTAAEEGLPLRALTVLGEDPFRLDTPANHRDAEWLADRSARIRADRKIHNRGLHYAMIGHRKPDGKTYVNDEKDRNWKWIQQASKAARWLGYIPWDDIIDEKNDRPLIREYSRTSPSSRLAAATGVRLDGYSPYPDLTLSDFTGIQPFHLVIFGEKSSLRPILADLAEAYAADLYLPSGEISDTMLYDMAESAVIDPRPMVVFTFSDCDPAGWQMPVSIAHKLRAFRESVFPDMGDFEVHRVGLLPDQAERLTLPQTPLKDKDKRAKRWRERVGMEGAEIDALIALHPDELRAMARSALAAYIDPSLNARIKAIRSDWEQDARQAIREVFTLEAVRDIRAEMDRLTAETEALDDHMEALAELVNLPPVPRLPDAVPPPGLADALSDSRRPLSDHIAALRATKEYRAA